MFLYYDWTNTSPSTYSDPFQVAVINPAGETVEIDNFDATIVAVEPDKDLGKCKCKGSTGTAAAGDPINIGAGNVYEEATDYISGGPNKLEFTRSFNSEASEETQATDLGNNWRSNYDRFLYTQVSSSIVTGILAVRPDGRGILFTPSGDNWVTDSDVGITLTGSTKTGFILKDEDDTVETYVSSAVDEFEWNASTIVYRGGYTQSLSFNTSGQLSEVTDQYGRSLTFAYNSTGQIASLVTPEGATIKYGYTASLSNPQFGSANVLTTVTYPGVTVPATLTYQYTDSNNPYAITAIIDENGQQYASWTYDQNGRGLTSQHGAGADLTTVAYDDSNASSGTTTATVTNALGVTDTYSFTMLQNVPKLTGISRAATSTTAAASESFTYDSNGYLASETDWNGNLTTYTNNALGEPTQVVEASGSSVARTTTTVWNLNFHVPDSVTTQGLVNTYTYDSAGNRTSRIDTATGLSRKWVYAWADALLASVTGPRTDLKQVTKYTYDSHGGVATVTDAAGHVTHLTNTVGSLPVKEVDPNGVSTAYSYDPRQRLLASVLTTSAGKLTTSYTYDPAGNLLQVTLPDGSFTANAYDPAHRLTAQADVLGETKTYALDALGDRTATVIANAKAATTWQDSDTFDALGRLITDVQGAGQTTSYSYDPDGNQVSVLDPLSRTTTRVYDALNRVSKVTDPAKGVTSFAYDAHDRILAVVAPNGAKTSYTYDGFGRRTKRFSPDTGTATFVYDLADNLTGSTDGAGIVTNSTYDALNRILTTTYPSDAAEAVAYIYDQSGHGDGIGRLTSLTDAVGSLSLSYDERGNELSETRVSGASTLTTQYAYDAASRLAGVGYPSGTAIGYTRDKAGQVAGVSATLPGASSAVTLAKSFAWEPFGPLLGLTNGNGVAEARTYDLSYRAKSVAAGSVVKQTYGYDADDDITGITDGITSANSQTLGYDTLNRLNAAKGAYGSFGWTYDANGNRLTQTGTAAISYSYAAKSNVLTSYTAGGIATTVTSNGIGSITAQTPASGSATALTYNAAERLASVAIGGTSAGTYTYDAFGQRSLKTASGVTSSFLFDQTGKLLEEIDTGTSTAKQDTVYLGAQPLADINPATGAIYWLHTDHLGTVQAATTSAKAVAWSGAYKPFGTVTAGKGLLTQNLRFAGQYADTATAFYQNGFRDYAPGLGRYVESDPYGLVGGLNTYAYVGNDPVNLRDPFGLAPPEAEENAPPFETMQEEFDREGREADPYNSQALRQPGPGEPGGPAACPTRGGAYTLIDPTTGQIMRSGRTNDFDRREAEHSRDPAMSRFKFDRTYPTDDYNEQRGLAQTLHDSDPPPPLDRMNDISSANPNRSTYMNAAQSYLNGGH